MDKAKNATEYAGDTAQQTYEAAGDTTEQTVDAAGDTAGQTFDAAANPSETVSSISSSFKPDYSIVWQGHLVYVILAAGSTLPWWAFVTAADYFQFLYPAEHIVRYFTLAYFVPWLIVYILVASFWRQGTSWIKIILGVSIAIVSLIIIPLLDGLFMGNKGTSATFWVTLSAVAIGGCADAVSQGSILGISSELPESFTQAYVAGASVSGVFVFILRVIIKASFSSSGTGLRIGAILYFSICALFLVFVIALFSYIHYMPVMGYYNSMGLGDFETVRLLIQDAGTVSIEVASGAAIASIAAGRSSPAQPLTWKSVLNRIKLLAIAAAVTAMVSLSIFPGVLTENVHFSKLGSWCPVLLVGTYVISDLLGRLSTAYSITRKHSTVFGLAWARFFLVALYIVVLLFGPKFFSSIVLVFILTALLGLSNGYLTSTLTVLIPRNNPPKEQESAGISNALFMNLGVLLGAGLSWLWILVN